MKNLVKDIKKHGVSKLLDELEEYQGKWDAHVTLKDGRTAMNGEPDTKQATEGKITEAWRRVKEFPNSVFTTPDFGTIKYSDLFLIIPMPIGDS